MSNLNNQGQPEEANLLGLLPSDSDWDPSALGAHMNEQIERKDRKSELPFIISESTISRLLNA